MVVGIDYSTKDCHCVEIDGHGQHVSMGVVKFKGQLSFDRLLTVRRALLADKGFRAVVAEADGLIVGIEDPRATNPKLRSMIAKLARVQGAIVQCLPEDAEVRPLNAMQWRTANELSGRASKDEIQAWAISEGMPAGLAQDYYDAFAIARAALCGVLSDAI